MMGGGTIDTYNQECKILQVMHNLKVDLDGIKGNQEKMYKAKDDQEEINNVEK